MMGVLFSSTNGQAPSVDIKDALLTGQAPDRGLYLPEQFPVLPAETIAAFRDKPYSEIAVEVLSEYTAGTIDHSVLRSICSDAYDFEVPLEHIYDRVHILRLDRGPTASFKDFAARLMARLIGRFVREEGRQLTVLTATSGDTGSAVANAFHGVDGIRVLVLFPISEVSDRQRKQMTTLQDNIRSIALDGKFDDCQALVKQAFADPALRGLSLSSANSINIGRLLPQSVYYFYAASRVADAGEPLVVVVPSGNFGNMMGAVVAQKMGLPIKRLVVPVNANDEFPAFLQTATYEKIAPSRACISNAMNVGHPSNLVRLVDIYGGWLDETGVMRRDPDIQALRQDLFSSSVTDEATRQTIEDAWNQYGALLEPHGAVAWRGFLDYTRREPLDGAPAVVAETAHPAKFPDEIEKILGIKPETPPSLARLDTLNEDFDRLDADYKSFRDYLLRNYSS